MTKHGNPEVIHSACGHAWGDHGHSEHDERALTCPVSTEDHDSKAELAAESEMVAALQAELSRVTEAAARQVAEAREEQREACALALDDLPTITDAHPELVVGLEDAKRYVRRTSLGATPISARVAELEAVIREWLEIDGPSVSLEEQRRRWPGVVGRMQKLVER